MSRIVTILSAIAVLLLAACGGPRTVVVPNGGGGWVGGSVPQLGDNAPHEWVGGHPYDHQVHGIDISRWQGNIDWNRARTSGISFAFLKATEGADHTDPEFRRYWREAGNARIPRGAYHYYYFCRSGVE